MAEIIPINWVTELEKRTNLQTSDRVLIGITSNGVSVYTTVGELMQMASSATVINRGDWVSGTTYSQGDFVFAESTAEAGVNSMYFLIGEVDYVSNLEPNTDLSHWSELTALKGDKGDQGEKGEKGDPLTWDDLTPAQKDSLKGVQGDSGWTPLFRMVIDGVNLDSEGQTRSVMELYDWFGGEGIKPALTGYVGASGIVADIANGTNLRGSRGAVGATGEQGLQGPPGEKGDTGDGLHFDETGPLSGRSAYDGEAPGFVYLADDEGKFYVRLDPTGWSQGVDIGAVTQTLSLGPTAGNISISGGNNVALKSLGYDDMGNEVDFTTMFNALPAGMSFKYVGNDSTGFPNTGTGSNSRALGLYVKQTLPRLNFAVAKGYSSSNQNKLYFNTGSTAGTGWNGWETFASEEWINANFVNTTGNQTGIAGNKTTTGTWTFSNLSGTGNGIVGVNASGALTRRPESDVIQTLSLGTGAGNIAISGGNSVRLTSLGRTVKNDANSRINDQGFHPFTADGAEAVGYPSSNSVTGFRSQFGGVTGTGFDLISSGDSMLFGKLFYKTFRVEAQESPFYTVASEEWANDQGWLKAEDLPTIGNGTLTLATTNGLSGAASFSANQSGAATFTVGVAGTHKLPTTSEWNSKAEIGTGAAQVRSNTDLDARYLQPYTVPAILTANKTLSASDKNAYIRVTGTRTITIPAGLSSTDYPIGSTTNVRVSTGATVTFAGASGVTLDHPDGAGNVSVEGRKVVSIVRVDTNAYDLIY